MITRQQYYENIVIQIFLCHQLENKECAFIRTLKDESNFSGTIRGIKAYMSHYLRMSFERFDFIKNQYNLYHSLASFKEFPVFSFNMLKRKQEQMIFNKALQDEYKENKPRYINGYDVGIDIDSDSVLNAINPSRIVKDLFDKYKLPYTIKSSGSHGIHFNIPSKYWMPNKSIKEKYDMSLTIVKNIKEAFNIAEIDLAGIYSFRRVWKVALSWDVISDLIAIPLNDEMFNNFNLDYCKPEYVLENIKQFPYDCFLRTYGLSEEQLIENIHKFIKDYGIT